jgi:hypothetical protein
MKGSNQESACLNMSKDKSRPEPEESSEAESFDIPYGGEVTIPSAEEPPAAPPDKKIHRRRPLPPVADRTQPDSHPPDRISREKGKSHGEKDDPQERRGSEEGGGEDACASREAR